MKNDIEKRVPKDVDWSLTGLRGGDLLAAAIAANGYNYTGIAAAAGYSTNHPGTLVSGKCEINRTSAEAYGKVLGVDPDLLVTTDRNGRGMFTGQSRIILSNLIQSARMVFMHPESAAYLKAMSDDIEVAQRALDEDME